MARLPGLPSPTPCATQVNEEEIEGNDYHHQNGRSNGHALSSNNPPSDPNKNHLRTPLISFRTFNASSRFLNVMTVPLALALKVPEVQEASIKASPPMFSASKRRISIASLQWENKGSHVACFGVGPPHDFIIFGVE